MKEIPTNFDVATSIDSLHHAKTSELLKSKSNYILFLHAITGSEEGWV